MTENISQALGILDIFVLNKTKQRLDDREKAIVSGALENHSYSIMKREKSALKGLTVEYISQYIAYHLWQKLNKT